MNLKSVLITGCSEGGLVAALAKAFQEEGYHVFATLRNPTKAGTLADEQGANIDVLPLDITSQESVDTCLEIERAKTGGKLGALVNNAGNGTTMPLLHLPIDEAQAIYLRGQCMGHPPHCSGFVPAAPRVQGQDHELLLRCGRLQSAMARQVIPRTSREKSGL